MIYGSVCSGIEAATVAWSPLGWRCSFMSEIDNFPRAVLAHHYPETPLHGDFTTIEAGRYEPIDLLVGGTPCQSFSVAGLRGGLDDDRGNLALEYLRLADRLRPRWLVWENVPGVLSSNSGRDFGSILGGMGELGYGVAYRVLDAQFFGVPQRRRRVFVVGYLGDWRRAAAVLFERHSLSGDSAPSRKAGEGIAPPTSPSLTRGYGDAAGQDLELDGALISKCLSASHTASGRLNPTAETFIAHSLRAQAQAQASHRADTETYVTHSLRAEGFDASEDGTGRGTPLVPCMVKDGDAHSGFRDEHGLIPVTFSITPSNSNKDYNAREVEKAQALTGGGNRPSARGGDMVMTLAIRGRGDSHNLETRDDGTANAILTPNGGRAGIGVGAVAILPEVVTIHGTDKTANAASMTDVAGSIRTKAPGSVENSSTTAALHGSAVRRLTPKECARLQGFPDDYLDITYRGKPAADGPKYKALGNSMATPVMRWIGERIQMVDDLNEKAAPPK